MVKIKGAERLFWDDNYKIQGYGVYLCKELSCISDFLNKKKFKKKYLHYLNDDCLEQLNSRLKGGKIHE